jgi:hypothetical protein
MVEPENGREPFLYREYKYQKFVCLVPSFHTTDVRLAVVAHC